MQVAKIKAFAHVAKALLRDTGRALLFPALDIYSSARAEGDSPLKAATLAAIPATLHLSPALAGAYFGAPKVGIASTLAYGVAMALLTPDSPREAFAHTRARLVNTLHA